MSRLRDQCHVCVLTYMLQPLFMLLQGGRLSTKGPTQGLSGSQEGTPESSHLKHFPFSVIDFTLCGSVLPACMCVHHGG